MENKIILNNKSEFSNLRIKFVDSLFDQCKEIGGEFYDCLVSCLQQDLNSSLPEEATLNKLKGEFYLKCLKEFPVDQCIYISRNDLKFERKKI